MSGETTLAKQIAGDPSGSTLRVRLGVVAAVSSPTCDVYIAGSSVIVPGVQYLNSAAPAVGDTVWMLTDGADLWVIGTLGPTAIATVAAVAAAQADASAAVLAASTAQSDADAANAAAAAAQADATQGLANAAAAQNDASTALTNAATAQTTANTANSAAATAQTAADTANSAAAAASTAAANAAGIANSKAVVLYQIATPDSSYQNALTLWINTTNNLNTPMRWNGTAWAAVTDSAAINAASAAAAAQTTANTANSAAATAQAQANTATTNAATAQTTANNAVAAAAAAQTAANNAQTTANAAQTTANGKNTVHYSTSAPVSGSTVGIIGDVWFQLGTGGTVGQIIAQFQCTAGSPSFTWSSVTVGSALIASLDVGKLTAGTINVALTLTAAKIIGALVTGGSLQTGTLGERVIVNVPPVPWISGGIYELGATCSPTVQNGFAYQVVSGGGYVNTTEPVWPTTLGGTVVDGLVTWQAITIPYLPQIYLYTGAEFERWPSSINCGVNGTETFLSLQAGSADSMEAPAGVILQSNGGAYIGGPGGGAASPNQLLIGGDIMVMGSVDALVSNIPKVPYAFAAHVGTAQSIPANTFTNVIYNTEEYDTYNNFNAATGVFTATATGIHRFDATCGFGSIGAAGFAYMRIMLNGATAQVGPYVYCTSSTAATLCSVAADIAMNAGDTVTFQVSCPATEPTRVGVYSRVSGRMVSW